MDLRANADLVASAGRNGDTTLVHMTPDEVQSLNQLALASGIGSLPVNPYTGYPEASFLGKLLKGIGSLAATVGGTALLGPLGGGLASALFTGLTEKNLNKGLRAGLMSYLGGKFLTGVADKGAEAAGISKYAGDKAVNPMVSTGDLVKSGVPLNEGALRGTDFLGGLKGAASDWGTARSALDAGGRELMRGPGAMMGMSMLGEVNNAIATDEYNARMLRDQADYEREVREAYRDFNRRFGRNPYANMYAGRYRGGGLVSQRPVGGYMDGGIMGLAGGGTVSPRGYKADDYIPYDLEPSDSDSGLERAVKKARLNAYQKDRKAHMRGYPGGDLGYQTLMPAQPQPGYLPGFHSEQFWMQPAGGQQAQLGGGQFGANPYDTSGVAAILNQNMPSFLNELSSGGAPGSYAPPFVPPPTSGPGGGVDPFEPTMAPPRSFAGGGMVNPRGGMGDGVPAALMAEGGMIDMVQVSPGEFVIPSDVVSMIGDGDTDAGAQELEDMMARIRLMKTGSAKQAPPINLDALVM